VRTQVDRDLTTVSRVDRQLGLNKNLGCHTREAAAWTSGRRRPAPSPGDGRSNISVRFNSLRVNGGWLYPQTKLQPIVLKSLPF
jgi:hypothetical protein